jgi:S-adenosyl-L-methionine hydrolase (adenosine-forming)
LIAEGNLCPLRNMAIITLTTDLGLKDHYVATIKGAILSQFAGATIVDVTHLITPFNTAQAAFVLKQAWPAFPRGTIHIIGVNPEADGNTPHLIVRQDGHFFIGADNGIFSLLFEGRPQEAFELTMILDEDHVAFPTRSVFVKAACHIARGGMPDVIGRKVQGVKEVIGFRPATDPTSIRAKIVHIDTFGNLVTNVRRTMFDEVGRGRRFQIDFGSREDLITSLSRSYGDVPLGERVAFFGASGLLEIAVNKGAEGAGGGAARLFGVETEDPVRIDFMERER